jgi:hypothetical protein
MRSSRTRPLNRIALVLGLLGVCLHVGVSAWHPAQRSWPQLLQAQFLADLQSAICHGDELTTPTKAPRDSDKEPPKFDCLICKNLAGSCLAVLAKPASLPFLRIVSHWVGPIDFDSVAGAQMLAPRNRGPPAGLA